MIKDKMIEIKVRANSMLHYIDKMSLRYQNTKLEDNGLI